MKSPQIFALVIGAIALFPSVSFAGDNISGNTQETTMDSTIIGNGNVVVSDVRQSNINLQGSGRYGTNVSGTNQRATTRTVIIGDGNVDVKKVVQEAIDRQHSN